MEKRSQRFLAVVLLFLGAIASARLLAHGSLAEFLNADGTVLRTNTVYNSDIIRAPKWTASPIPLVFCVGPVDSNGNPLPTSSYARASISQRVPNDIPNRTNELLADIQAAVNTWNAVTGGATFANPVTSTDCGPVDNLGDPVASPNGQNRITFTNTLPDWILAYTTLHLAPINGELRIVEADIEFNRDYDPLDGERFRTGACESACGTGCTNCEGSCGGCGGASFEVTFRGVLTHELGHLIGMSHSLVTDDNSTDNLNSVSSMFPSISSLSQSRAIQDLNTDDILGKLNLYKPQGFPASNQGSISGFVRSTAGQIGLRGAHVYAFDVATKRTLAGTFTGMSGIFAASDGSYQIDGLPLETPFIVVVEPADRSDDVHPALTADAYNFPISAALQNETTGLRSFAVEAFPDTQIVDIRKTNNSTISPGITNAEVITLTSSQKTRSNINFYVSNVYLPPNDLESLIIQFPQSTSINDSNPLRITLSSGVDLSAYASSRKTMTAVINGSVKDWTAGIPEATMQGSSVVLNIDPTKITPPDGTYPVTFRVEHPTIGTFSSTKTLQISKWKLPFGATSASSGSGGCSLDRRLINESR